MLHGRAPQRLWLVSAFEGGYHTPLGMAFGDLHDFPRYPVVIAVQQVDLSHIVVGVSVETGRDQYHLWFETVQGRQPVVLYGLLEGLTAGAGFERRVDNVPVFPVQRSIGIERVLEGRTQHHPLIILKNAFSTITVVDIEIDNRHPRQPGGKGMGCTYRCVVKDAESHCPFPLGVVPGWADSTERRVDLATQ